MQRDQIQSTYIEAWRRFGDEMSTLTEAIGAFAERPNGSSLHELVRELHWVPYREARRILERPSDASSENIGAVSGLFFEQIVVAVMVPYLRARCPGVAFERNCCSDAEARRIARDPDLVAKLGDRIAIFEIKTSPKRRDLEYVARLRQDYEQAARVAYFVIGGHVSLNRRELVNYASIPRVAFMSASDRNKAILGSCATLDALLEDAVDHLLNADER